MKDILPNLEKQVSENNKGDKKQFKRAKTQPCNDDNSVSPSNYRSELGKSVTYRR